MSRLIKRIRIEVVTVAAITIAALSLLIGPIGLVWIAKYPIAPAETARKKYWRFVSHYKRPIVCACEITPVSSRPRILSIERARMAAASWKVS